MRVHSRWILIFIALIASVFGVNGLILAEDPAQIPVSATPARISIPSPIPIETDAMAATPTETPTPTPIGAILLEAVSEANVRSSPDIGAEKLGTIRAGEIYPIIGRSYRWLQFQYDVSPSGTGWVYDELVNVVGNPNDIVDLNANILPTVDTSSVNATQTWEALQQTPGGLLTATANSRIIQVPGSDASGSGRPLGPEETEQVLPTFTYPPEVISQAPLSNTNNAQIIASTDNLAEVVDEITPITPILIFGAFGILGLFISSLRRG